MSDTVTAQTPTVAELAEKVGGIKTNFQESSLGDVRLAGDVLTVDSREVPLDEPGLNVLSKFLKVPGEYMQKLPDELRAQNINYWLQRSQFSDAIFELANDHLIGMFSADQEIIPRERIVEVIAETMKPTDSVRRLEVGDGWFICDVSTGEITAEPRVGDITEGGLRFKATMAPKSTAGSPYVSSFLYRLDCSNGMTHREEFGRVHLKGKTTETILEKMTEAANTLLADVVPVRLEQYGKLSDLEIDKPEQYVLRLMEEARIAPRTVQAVVGEIPELEERTAYDLVNLMAEQQHHVASGAAVLKLQEVAGTAIARQDAHRCTQCFSLLT